MSTQSADDRWKAALAREKEKLQKCQNDRKLKSCLPCPEIVECETRKSYVDAVYKSMNRGKGGGFEF